MEKRLDCDMHLGKSIQKPTSNTLNSIRQFTFADVDITFDIPKFLTLSDCSFLISFMKFDNYSVECASFVPHKINKTHSLIGTKPIEDTVTETPVMDLDIIHRVSTEEPHTDVFSEYDKISPSEDVDETAAEREEVIEPPPEDLVPTPEPDEWERVELSSDAVDLGEYHVIGGVIRFDLLNLPRQPRSGRGWSITTCVRPPSLQPFEYIVDTIQNTQTNPEQTELAEKKEERKDEKPPVQVKFRLPPCLVIAEKPLLARWDPEVNQWRTSGIELEEFKEDENLIVLRTSVFGTMAIFQDFHINMPFQAWELRPLPFHQIKTVTGAQSVSAATNDYTLGFGETVPMTSVFSAPVYRSHTGARSTQVTTDQYKEAATNASGLEGTATEPSKDRAPNGIAEQVMILGPVPTLGLSDEAYLSELPDTNQCVLTITGGLTELRLHILGERIAVLPSLPHPNDFSDNPITEQRLYEQMALLSPAIAFGWSRWNAECLDRNTIIVTAVEHVDQDHSVDEDTWRVYAMTRKKVTLLNMKEYDEAFDPAVDKKQPFHADFFHMFMDIGSEEAKRRVRKIDLKYFKTVKQMLQATRLAVFS
ncbi:cancer susceptibility candidate protein 1 [Paragonimus westermani]|uniref:Cancer susceptibility candidate protein 1 n=1 Tax=Paragonimus westermani TaxID=34504 RepID=A0A5J4NR38_9TREM|nr:cancer susceptibility candidate protein 1 [Paragonimus westermani]